jgi:hypothetical protein
MSVFGRKMRAPFPSRSPPVLHRWEPGLETTARAPPICLSSPPVLYRWEPGLETTAPRPPLAPHRSCTGGSPVWKLPRACRRPSALSLSSSLRSRSPPVLHRWEPGLATTRASPSPICPFLFLSALAPHRSCTGGSRFGNYPRARPPSFLSSRFSLAPHRSCTGGSRFGN